MCIRDSPVRPRVVERPQSQEHAAQGSASSRMGSARPPPDPPEKGLRRAEEPLRKHLGTFWERHFPLSDWIWNECDTPRRP
eukprot:14590777-Alexandrium_andersonii.AAC.1